MDKDFQEEFRTTLYKQYQARAFECFAIHTYYGKRYETGSKDVELWEGRIKDIEAKIAALGPHDKSQRNALKADIKLYKKNIEAIVPVLQKLFTKSSQPREEALELLEQAEYIKAFKLITPEEIEANKAKGDTNVPDVDLMKPLDESVKSPFVEKEK